MHRRLAIIASALALVIVAVPLLPARAQTSGAMVDKTGWWSEFGETVSTPAGPIAAPAPQIPEGSITTGEAGEDSYALAAVGIVPDAPVGSTPLTATLVLNEDDAPAGQNEGGAPIVACPITGFWVGGENGDIEDAPVFDCTLAAAPGERDAEAGTWTFDLLPIATLWFDSASGVRADGVALVSDPEADPTAYQVIWTTDDIQVSITATPPADDGTDGGFGFTPTPTTSGSSGGGSFGGGSDGGFDSGGGGGTFTPPDTTPATVATDPSESPDTTAPALDGEVASPPEPISVSRAGDTFGNLPFATVLMVPLLLLVLVAMSWWLGQGEPVTVQNERRGGVSRALEARRRANRTT